MARNNKPVKIKRYKNSMGTQSQSVAAAKRLMPFVLGAVLVVGIGFLMGGPVINFISGIGSGADSSQSSSRTQQVSQRQTSSKPEESEKPAGTSSQPADSSEQQSSQSQDTVITVEKNRVYYYANAVSLSTEPQIDAVIKDMKAKGATHLVFDAKNADGYVHYTSANRYASQLAAETVVDIPLLVSKLAENGLTPVARMYTFMDKMVSTVERTTAVMYLGTETRWLDTSAALGGKAWANPASKLMQDYILRLTDELLSMGVKEIIYAGFSTPTGYSLDKRDFGATTDQVLANMKNLIVTLQAKISAKDGYSAWQIEYSAVMPEGSYAQYIVHPYQLGAENIILTAKGSEIDTTAVVAEVTAAARAAELNSVTLWLTDNTAADATQSMDNYFVF